MNPKLWLTLAAGGVVVLGSGYTAVSAWRAPYQSAQQEQVCHLDVPAFSDFLAMGESITRRQCESIDAEQRRGRCTFVDLRSIDRCRSGAKPVALAQNNLFAPLGSIKESKNSTSTFKAEIDSGLDVLIHWPKGCADSPSAPPLDPALASNVWGIFERRTARDPWRATCTVVRVGQEKWLTAAHCRPSLAERRLRTHRLNGPEVTFTCTRYEETAPPNSAIDIAVCDGQVTAASSSATFPGIDLVAKVRPLAPVLIAGFGYSGKGRMDDRCVGDSEVLQAPNPDLAKCGASHPNEPKKCWGRVGANGASAPSFPDVGDSGGAVFRGRDANSPLVGLITAEDETNKQGFFLALSDPAVRAFLCPPNGPPRIPSRACSQLQP